MRSRFVMLLGVAVMVSACEILAGFGPDRELTESSTGGEGGSGGAAGTGGTVGVGGAGGSVSPHACDPTSDVQWMRRFGDPALDAMAHLAPAPGGGVYVSGSFDGAIDLGAGPLVTEGGRDFFAARYDEQGQLSWARRYGKNLDDDGIGALAPHPQGVVLLGSTNVPLDVGEGEYEPFGKAAFVTLLNPDGEHLWTTWLDGPGATQSLEVTVDPATKDILVFTAFSGQLQLGTTLHDSNNGSNDALLIRLAGADGMVLDSYAYGGPVGDWAQAIDVAADGTILVVGSSDGSVDFGEGLQPSNGVDGYAAAFTPGLELIWARQYAEGGNQHFEAMALAPDGNMVAVGKMIDAGSVDLGHGPVYGDRDAYVVRIRSTNGDILHGRMIQGIDEPQALVVDAQGDVIVAGEYEDTLVLGAETFHSVEGWGDPFLFALSSDFADVTWRNVPVGSYQSESFRDLVIGDDGSLLVSGSFYHDLLLEGCGVRQSAGDADALLFKRKP